MLSRNDNRLAVVLAIVATVVFVGLWLWRAGTSSPSNRPPLGVTPTTPATSALEPVGSSSAPLSPDSTSRPVRVIDLPAANPAPDPRPLFGTLLAEPPPRDPVALAVRMGRTTTLPPRVAADARPAGKAVGDIDHFWVHDIEAERYFSVTARLEVLTANAAFWVQDGLPFNREDLESGAKAFSDEVMPRLRQVFGSEWSPGIDNDPRVVVLHHQAIAGVAGYFSSPDEFTRLVEPYSNEHEMFNINLSSARPGSFEYLALLSHEFQHMIHWNTDSDESVWANEGLSDLAPHMVRYGQQNGSAYLQAPDTPLMEWETQPHANAAHYAASYLFFAYLRAQYGDAVLKAFNAAPANGPNGVEEALRTLGRPRTFEDIFLDWVIANAVHDEVPRDLTPVDPFTTTGEADRTLAPRYTYDGADVDAAEVVDWPAGEGAELDETVGQFAADYWNVTSAVTEGTLALDFTGDPAVRLLGAEPNERGKVWWSGRGENMDSRLTRAFDLTGVKSAQLEFKLWYDIEDKWDFAYYLASTDGGEHWQRLKSSRTIDENPNGNNYGRGLTGERRAWVDERLDLTPFAGQTVLVSFELMTDDAVSRTGLALDDFRLETVGFGDDVEGGTDGWLAEGFRVVDPTLPQHWGLQVIVVDAASEAIDIWRVGVGADGKAAIRLGELPGSARVILAVSGLTPATREPAHYRLTLPIRP